jgi:hypothetical protein
MGSVIALRERQPLVPNTPSDRGQLIAELRELSTRLKVEDILSGWGYAVRQIKRDLEDADAYLLVLDTNSKTITITGFRKSHLAEASDAYLSIERTSADNPHLQAVLVSVDSVSALSSAYPNYYLDTRAFLKELRRAVGTSAAKREHPIAAV